MDHAGGIFLACVRLTQESLEDDVPKLKQIGDVLKRRLSLSNLSGAKLRQAEEAFLQARGKSNKVMGHFFGSNPQWVEHGGDPTKIWDHNPMSYRNTGSVYDPASRYGKAMRTDNPGSIRMQKTRAARDRTLHVEKPTMKSLREYAEAVGDHMEQKRLNWDAVDRGHTNINNLTNRLREAAYQADAQRQAARRDMVGGRIMAGVGAGALGTGGIGTYLGLKKRKKNPSNP
jgi:hypothetical protein